MNESITAEIRDKAKELLESKQVDCVIGYEASTRDGARPVFIYDPADVDRLVWNEHCVHNLVTYLHDKKKPQKRGEEPQRVAVVAKPCDSRAVNVLLAEQQMARERVFVIGVACEGMKEAGSKGQERCARCVDRIPVIYDTLIGEPPEVTPVEDDFADLAEVEGLPPNERLAFWLRQFDRCIRCYACRQV